MLDLAEGPAWIFRDMMVKKLTATFAMPLLKKSSSKFPSPIHQMVAFLQSAARLVPGDPRMGQTY